jgi:hypothetical protein
LSTCRKTDCLEYAGTAMIGAQTGPGCSHERKSVPPSPGPSTLPSVGCKVVERQRLSPQLPYSLNSEMN